MRAADVDDENLHVPVWPHPALQGGVQGRLRGPRTRSRTPETSATMTRSTIAAEEDAVLDDAGNGGQPRRQRDRIGDAVEGRVHQQVAVVAAPRPRRHRVRAEAAHLRGGDRRGERQHLERQAGTCAKVSTSFDPSTTTMKRAAMAATIFSRTCAPPPPLVRLKARSTSSAPSMARSSAPISSGVTTRRPRSVASGASARRWRRR